MSSTYSRGQIVLDALSLAGRSTELKQSCNQWLNYFLLHIGSTFRFPELRKIGALTSLPIGQNTIPLPSDFGNGMEKHGMIFGDDAKPLDEMSFEDFSINNGFPPAGTGIGRPINYIVDRNAGVFRFNMVADQSYPVTPVYFIAPPLLPVSTSSDSSSVWLDNDLIAIEGLVWMIYKFTNDEREEYQMQAVYKMINEWKREIVKMGGRSRVIPSPATFKNVKFGGYYGP